MEQLNNTPSPVYAVSNDVVSNFSPSVQLSTSGLFTLAGSAQHAHCRQHRHGSHTISPYTPRMTNPLSPCHRLNSLRSEEETLTLSSQREGEKNSGKEVVKMDEIKLSRSHSQYKIVAKLSMNPSANFLVNLSPSSGKFYAATFIKWRPSAAMIGP